MSEALNRVIASVGTGQRFGDNLTRLRWLLRTECMISWLDRLPSESPSHEEIPYGFKIWAIEDAVRAGYRYVWWMDSSVMPIAPLQPVWDLIKDQGYWFSRNYDYPNGEFTCDAALPILGVTREESFGIPHVVTTTFGLDMEAEIGKEFLRQWKELALAGAFYGPWSNEDGQASSDRRVRGHRHDQTAASVVAHRLGMTLTTPPQYFAEQGFPQAEQTILTVMR